MNQTLLKNNQMFIASSLPAIEVTVQARKAKLRTATAQVLFSQFCRHGDDTNFNDRA